MGVLGRISELVCLHGMKVGISQLSGNLRGLQWTDISPVGRGGGVLLLIATCHRFSRDKPLGYETSL